MINIVIDEKTDSESIYQLFRQLIRVKSNVPDSTMYVYF